jgi:hypothetical protein
LNLFEFVYAKHLKHTNPLYKLYAINLLHATCPKHSHSTSTLTTSYASAAGTEAQTEALC